MKTNYVVASIVLFLVVIASAVGYTIYQNQTAQSEIIEVSSPPLPSPIESFSETPPPSSRQDSAIPQVQPQAGSADSQNKQFTVIEPKNNTHLTFPFVVRGYSTRDETVAISVIDSNGKIVAEQNTPCEGEIICQFYSLFDIPKPQILNGTVVVETESFSKTIQVNFN